MHDPVAGEHVLLHLPASHEEVPAKVERYTGDAYEVRLLKPPRTPLERVAKAAVWMQWMDGEGVWRQDGTIKRRLDGADLVNFVGGGRILLMRKHEDLKVVVKKEAAVLPPGTDPIAFKAICVEASVRGLRFEGPQFAEKGDLIYVAVPLIPKEAPLQGQLRVDGVDRDGGVSAHWTVLPTSERRRVLAFVTERSPTVR